MAEEAPRESRKARLGALRLGIAYFAIASLWILVSDHLVVLLARDAQQLHFLQSIKGIGFVLLMAVLVGVAAARLARAEAERQRAQLFAATDPVTRLPNARAFYAAVADALAAGTRGAVLLFDIRDFARINATFGHQAGDQALFNTGRNLRALAGPGGFVARLEEDKFGLLLPEADTAQGNALAERVVERFRSEMRLEGKSVQLGVNLGFALLGEDGEEVAALVDAADLALRMAKESGHNSVAKYSAELQRTRREHFHLEAELRQALDERQLGIQLQPQYELADGSLHSAEALLRWTHPQRGPISPAVFIPVAERAGLIERISEYVLQLACQAQSGWRAAGLPATRIAVNVAGQQLDDERLGFFLMQAAEEWGVPPSGLEIEITESMAMRNPARAIDVLTRLRNLGVTVALDDFGTGYSSLSYLLQLPIDKLKIDRSFITDLEGNWRQRSFVHTLIGLGRELGLRVVAEGIETDAQRDHLLALGCDLGQGYLLGHPMAVDDFAALLRRGRPRPAG